MRYSLTLLAFVAITFLYSCSSNPYASTNRAHKKKIKAYTKSLKAVPSAAPDEELLQMGDYWVGTTNFNMRKANYVVIHHTAQNSTEKTLQTFTTPSTVVSAHYVIGSDGKVYHMLNDYLRAWHGGIGKWGSNTDLNSSSIGIELDNNGSEPFSDAQINSLLQVLAVLKKTYGIPTANFIGHSDIAPTRKVDPNPTFPWKKLAENGFGLWYDEDVLNRTAILDRDIILDSAAVLDSTVSLDSVIIFKRTIVVNKSILNDSIPASFNPQEALRIIGYDTQDLEAAIKAFKLHFIQSDLSATLTEEDKRVLYNLYKKYL
ncbi:N-acetylmuramoyl-L-alanine amidase [Pontibacter silvestris]|uniref:N-acetylmuramoyl-L-alanine amidase n=1 Tax=Pontibacter silvestris TaxID=2305183 RepID=A0ABW4WY41_9BACT|nr:N-acetylmuramoyl-L-alanine amidase [Pontibacter silvestris]MCC9136761.1 N-acetylmuramoyl-L-alanine amidase [Pontibacter silvestris]